jgi:tetratricopeptide (TPR) repeat protein
MSQEQLRRESLRVTFEQWQKNDPWDLSPDECWKNLLNIRALIDETVQETECKADLYFEQGRLFGILQNWNEEIASYDNALEVKANLYQAWFNRGIALENLGRYEEAVTSYNEALKIKPDYREAFSHRDYALYKLGCHEQGMEVKLQSRELRTMSELKLISKHSGPLKSLVEGAIIELLNSTEEAIRYTEQRIYEFEKKYQLSTQEFLGRFENDEFQETLDLDEWIGESRMLQRLQEKAERLRGIEFAN